MSMGAMPSFESVPTQETHDYGAVLSITAPADDPETNEGGSGDDTHISLISKIAGHY
jgi:hypothetical protein